MSGQKDIKSYIFESSTKQTNNSYNAKTKKRN